MRTNFGSIGAVLLALALALPLAAESINPPTRPQTAPMTAQEKKNLEMVMTWWREVLYAGHFELAPKYQAENYIQHNPNVNTGRAGFIEFFTKLGRKPMNPIPKAMPADQLPVVSGAKGDFVWLIFEHEDKDPRNPANTYHYNSFDVLRIENGKVQEHWDSAQKNAGHRRREDRRLTQAADAMEHRQALEGRREDPGHGHRGVEGHAPVRPPGTGRQDHGPRLHPAQPQRSARAATASSSS